MPATLQRRLPLSVPTGQLMLLSRLLRGFCDVAINLSALTTHSAVVTAKSPARPRASVLSSHLLAGFCMSHQSYLHASVFLSLYLSTYVTVPVLGALCWRLSHSLSHCLYLCLNQHTTYSPHLSPHTCYVSGFPSLKRSLTFWCHRGCCSQHCHALACTLLLVIGYSTSLMPCSL